MRAPARRRPRRPGTTVVESALVISFFLLFLFGLFEYCRYLFVLHVVQNAARDGARYASVNVTKPNNFDYADATVGGVVYPSVWRHTANKTGGVNNLIGNFAVSTFPCDNAKLNSGTAPKYTPVIDPKAGYVAPAAANYASGTAATGSALANRTVHWNGAAFSERLAVRVTGTYAPILPNFLYLNGVNSVTITAVMGSEG